MVVPVGYYKERMAMDEIDIDNYEIVEDENKVTVKDLTTGEVVTVLYDDARGKVVITSSDSSAETITIQDGRMYIGSEEVTSDAPVEEETSEASVPSGFKLLVAHGCAISTYEPGARIIATALGYLPKLGPIPLGRIVKELTLMRLESVKYAYVQFIQYYNPHTYWIYNLVRIYRNRNFTGLMESVEDGPKKPV